MNINSTVVTGVRWLINSAGKVIGYKNPLTDADVRTDGRAGLALTDAATIVVDAGSADNFRVTLAGDRTLANPTDLTDGQVLRFRVTQDGTGTRLLAYGSMYKFPGGAPALTTTAAAKDYITCQYDETAGTLFCTLSKAMA